MIAISILTLLAGCKRELAPEIPEVTPALTLRTEGYFHGSTVFVRGEVPGLRCDRAAP